MEARLHTDRDDPCGSINFADATGEMILTVVSTHKLGAAERVFYTRQWRDPDGKVFGADSKLRITSSAGFTMLTRGYHDFEV